MYTSYNYSNKEQSSKPKKQQKIKKQQDFPRAVAPEAADQITHSGYQIEAEKIKNDKLIILNSRDYLTKETVITHQETFLGKTIKYRNTGGLLRQIN